MDISVIICTFNRCQSLKEALDTLLACRVPPDVTMEVLVVDNNSTDGTRNVVDEAARQDRRVRYLFEPRQGKSHALNAGVKSAYGNILAFTDDDVEVDPGWIEALIDGFRAGGSIGVAGKIVDVWPQPAPEWYSVEGPYRLMAAIVRFDLGEEVRPLTVPPFGANMAFRRTAFDRYGLFDVRLGPTAGSEIRGEDTEFARRVMDAGETVLYLPEAVIRHPVEEHRISKRFFLRWYHDYGRAQIRKDGWPEGAVKYWGVPRYILRDYLRSVFASLRSVSPRARFYHRLQASQLYGQMKEARRISSISEAGTG